MSEPTIPALNTLHEMALRLKRDLKQSREILDFMEEAGLSTAQAEIDYKNNLVKYERWAGALRAKGYTDV